MGGPFAQSLGLVLADSWFLESKVSQQPVKLQLIRCVESSGLFESSGSGKYFINKAFKADSQRMAISVQNLI